ncbi:hypothetical protein GCM10009846_10470 [Agrococcus versicolor]|uniref:Sensor histidine kinase n=1 Tax=Agrococcus versicolor TaxID=501482 RepID=A0ABN3AMJ8_9MICO
MRTRSLLDALWAMTVLTSVVLVVVTAGSLLVALGAGAAATVRPDAWHGVVMAAPGLLLSSTALAALTVLRLRRATELDVVTTSIATQPAVVHVVMPQPERTTV